MAIRSELSYLEEQDAVYEQERNINNNPPQAQSLAYHPSAPPDELFDISTTVDPGFVISLIRKLLPSDTRNSLDPHGVGTCDDFAKESNTGDSKDRPISSTEYNVSSSTNNKTDAMDTIDDFVNNVHEKGEDKLSLDSHEKATTSAGEQAWEESGCILWDLSASRTHAEFMVENLVLEVLSASILVSQSSRVKEISLGIIGNLACHEVPRKQIVAAKGLIEIIVDQLFLDVAQCLCEACRLITLGLQSRECMSWAEALRIETVLCRIIWIAENALNPQLIEKCIELLLAMLETQQEAVLVLLPPMMKLGLADILVNLFACEMNKLRSERMPERYSVLDIVLRAIEALSVIDGHSHAICLNTELFQPIYDLIKLDDKVEVANSCVTAAVLFANILGEVPDIASDMSHDLPFIQGLLEIFHFASDDVEALNALWSAMARILARVAESTMTLSSLHQYVSILVSHTDFIKEDLLDSQADEPKEQETLASSCAIGGARTLALRKISSILNEWKRSKDSGIENDSVGENDAIDENVKRLLLCCSRYTK